MLRDAGATESILILGDTADDMLDEAAKYDLDLTVFSMEVLRTWLPLQEEPARNRTSR